MAESHEATIARLKAQIADQEAEIEALRRISEATGSALATPQILQSIAEIAMRITDTEVCHVFLFNETKDELVLRAATGDDQVFVDNVRLKVGEGITGWVAEKRQHVAVPDQANTDPRFKENPYLQEQNYRSMLSVPLEAKGEAIGVINVRTREPHDYSMNHVRLLSGIANHLAGAIDHLRQMRRLRQQAMQIVTLSEVSRSITSQVYLEEILQLLVNMTAQTMGYKVVNVRIVDEESRELILKATQAVSPEYRAKPPGKLGESIAGQAVAENRAITVLDVREHPEYRFPEIARREGLVSVACVPIRGRESAVGVLSCYTERPHVFGEDEIATLEAVANQAALAIEHAKLMMRSAILQEMHHRVKNNLQQIASLLRLQLGSMSAKNAEEVINDCLRRILAIASVHELLSREDLDTVSARKVASSILYNVHQALAPEGSQFKTSVVGDDALLPTQQATAVALILNELIQNAMEHGFGDASTGSIEVAIKNSEGRIVIDVVNDGREVGQVDPTGLKTLGLRIVDNLARGTLGGRFLLTAENGKTRASLDFPKSA